MEVIRILIFLDTIIDAKIGCVRSVNDEWVEPLIKNGYGARLTNQLSFINPEIDDKLVKEKWVNRDREILKLGFSTEILLELLSRRKESEKVGVEHPESFNIEVTLNTWPYKLSKDEVVEFTKSIAEVLKIESVKQIYREPAHCTPLWIKESYDHVILYDFNEWMAGNCNKLVRDKIPNVVFTFPLCYLDGVDPTGKPPKESVDYYRFGFSQYLVADVIPLGVMSAVGVLK